MHHFLPADFAQGTVLFLYLVLQISIFKMRAHCDVNVLFPYNYWVKGLRDLTVI